MKKSIFQTVALIFWALVIGCSVTGCKSKKQQHLLIVGLQSGYPPFEFRDEKGEIVGFDVDVGKKLAHLLGKTCVFHDMEFEGTILSLKQEKIDVIISGMQITPSRLKEIEMVPYHGDEAISLSLVFWGKVPENVRTIEDVGGLPKGISVQAGSISEMYMERHPSIPVKSFQGALSPLMDVKFGKSSANLVEPDVAIYLASQHPEISILEIPLAPEEQIAGFGIGIKKGNYPLLEEVSETVERLKQSGQLKQLEKKWFQKGENG